MNFRPLRWPAFAGSAALILAVSAQQTPAPPTAEQVFKDIEVFKGVPANDLIPAMEFMSASLKMPCTGCHTPGDYAAKTKGKDDARKMVLLQRDINQKWFNGRLEVTCMSCHNGKDHPVSMPVPTGVIVSHELADVDVEPDVLFAKHIKAAGAPPAYLKLTGTLTAPNPENHQPETKPAELIQSQDGKFRFASGSRLFGSDGKQVWYGPNVLGDEPAANIGRFGRSWRGDGAFGGLQRPILSGKDTIGRAKMLVVRANRPGTGSIEDLYFDEKSGLLSRLVNIKRSTIGRVVSSIDYSGFKAVGGLKVPMKVVVNFGSAETWTLEFKAAKVESSVPESAFTVGGG